jgi:hypothetical protein
LPEPSDGSPPKGPREPADRHRGYFAPYFGGYWGDYFGGYWQSVAGYWYGLGYEPAGSIDQASS